MEIYPEDVHPLAVGVFQVFWNYPLEEYPVTSPLGCLRSLPLEDSISALWQVEA